MKLKSILKIILVIILVIILFGKSEVRADGISDVISGGDDFIQAGSSEGVKVDEAKLKDTSSAIYNILLIIGIAVAVIISSILGIRFMIGSAEEKANVKDELVPFIVGCIVVFGAFAIWKLFVTLGINSIGS